MSVISSENLEKTNSTAHMDSSLNPTSLGSSFAHAIQATCNEPPTVDSPKHSVFFISSKLQFQDFIQAQRKLHSDVLIIVPNRP